MAISRRIIELALNPDDPATLKTHPIFTTKGYNCLILGYNAVTGLATIEVWCSDHAAQAAADRKNNANLGTFISSIAPVRQLPSHANSPTVIGKIRQLVAGVDTELDSG